MEEREEAAFGGTFRLYCVSRGVWRGRDKARERDRKPGALKERKERKG